MNINRLFRLIPFVITQLILLFCFLLIVNACYKYHLETEERRQLLKTVKCEHKKPVEEIKKLVEEKPVEIQKVINIEEEFYDICLKLKEEKDFIFIPEEFKKSLLMFIGRFKIKYDFSSENLIVDGKINDKIYEVLYFNTDGSYEKYYKLKNHRCILEIHFYNKQVDKIILNNEDRKTIKTISLSNMEKYCTY